MAQTVLEAVATFLIDARPADGAWLLAQGRIAVQEYPTQVYAPLTPDALALVVARFPHLGN